MKIVFTGAPLAEDDTRLLEIEADKLVQRHGAHGILGKSFIEYRSVFAYLTMVDKGLVTVHTFKDHPRARSASATKPEYEDRTSSSAPDFMSGMAGSGRYIFSPQVHVGEDSEEVECEVPMLIDPSPVLYDSLFPVDVAREKLCIPTALQYSMAEYPPQDIPDKGITYAELAKKPAGYFTTNMAALIQMWHGIGRLQRPNGYARAAKLRGIPNVSAHVERAAIERARRRKKTRGDYPPAFRYQPRFIDSGKPAHASNSAYPFSAETPFDYRWHRTHNVVLGKDLDGKHMGFIIEVSPRGVYAYPLPVDPITQVKKVQRHMIAVYPWLESEHFFGGLDVFTAFGGIPLPILIPTAELDVAVSEGRAARLCDTGAFYSGAFAIGTKFGWSFSQSTGEAINVTFKWTGSGDTMLMSSFGYKLSVKNVRLEKDDDGKVTVEGYASLREACGSRRGPIYHPARLSATNAPCKVTPSPKFHFYEPILGEMMSLDLRYGRAPTGKEKCDAPLAGGFVGNDAHFLFYEYDSTRKPKSGTSDDGQPCQFSGTRTTKTWTDQSTSGYFYSSSHDFRSQTPESLSVTASTMAPLIDFDMTSQNDFFAREMTTVHLHYHTVDTTSTTSAGMAHVTAVCWSSTDRNAYYVMEGSITSSKTKSRFHGVDFSGYGPQVRYTAMYHFISHWSGGTAHNYTANYCTEPKESFVEERESCFSSTTESIVGLYRHYTVAAGGEETCSYYASQKTVIVDNTNGIWGIGWTTPEHNERVSHMLAAFDSAGQRYQVDKKDSTEFKMKVTLFGVPTGHGTVTYKVQEERAPDADNPITLEDFGQWLRPAIPGMCPFPPMPVLRNYFGREFVLCYNDLSWSAAVKIGAVPDRTKGPDGFCFGGI